MPGLAYAPRGVTQLDLVDSAPGLSWMHAVTTILGQGGQGGQGLVGGWIAADRLFPALTSLFATLQDSWILRIRGLSLQVQRCENAVRCCHDQPDKSASRTLTRTAREV